MITAKLSEKIQKRTEWSMEEKGAGNNQERNLYREESNRCMEW